MGKKFKELKFSRSDGKIHDFAGSYYVSIDDMAFGEPYKYVEIEPTFKEGENWDDNLQICDNRFFNEEHNIFL